MPPADANSFKRCPNKECGTWIPIPRAEILESLVGRTVSLEELEAASRSREARAAPPKVELPPGPPPVQPPTPPPYALALDGEAAAPQHPRTEGAPESAVDDRPVLAVAFEPVAVPMAVALPTTQTESQQGIPATPLVVPTAAPEAQCGTAEAGSTRLRAVSVASLCLGILGAGSEVLAIVLSVLASSEAQRLGGPSASLSVFVLLLIIVGAAASIAAIILGALGLKRANVRYRGRAIGGLVSGIIGTCLVGCIVALMLFVLSRFR